MEGIRILSESASYPYLAVLGLSLILFIICVCSAKKIINYIACNKNLGTGTPIEKMYYIFILSVILMIITTDFGLRSHTEYKVVVNDKESLSEFIEDYNIKSIRIKKYIDLQEDIGDIYKIYILHD